MDATVKTIVFWLVIGISVLLLWQVIKSEPGQKSREVSYSQFMSQVEAGEVAKVTISGNRIEGQYRSDGSAFQVVGPTSQEALLAALRSKGVEIWFRDAVNGGSWPQILGTWAPLILLGALWFFMIRQMQTRQRDTRASEQRTNSDLR